MAGEERTRLICPLLSISHAGYVERCAEQDCAWWIEDVKACAVQSVGYLLDAIHKWGTGVARK